MCYDNQNQNQNQNEPTFDETAKIMENDLAQLIQLGRTLTDKDLEHIKRSFRSLVDFMR